MPTSVRTSAMRSAAVAAALAAVVIGVTAPVQASHDASPATLNTAVATASTVGGAISRTEILQRAQYWVDQRVPYSQSAYYQDPQGRTYRTDCSGMVSMAWHLSTSATTWTLPNYSTQLPDLDDLQPGDALNNVNHHVVLFVSWTDSSHTTANIMEEARPGTVAQKTTYSRSYITANGFKPYRYNKVIETPVTVPDKGMANVTSVGDLTGDGVNDVIAVEITSGDLYRYSGPNYTGGTARVKIGYGWNSMSDIVGVGDLTGDGVTDIIAVDAETGKLYRYSGPYYNGATKVEIGTNWDAMTNIAAVGDLTGDGVPDLIAVEKSTGKLYRYSGPTYNGGSRIQIGTGWNIYSAIVGVGDLTGDGVTDIIAVDTETGNLYRYSGPNYNGATKVQIGTQWDAMINITGAGDITGDDIPDLLAVEASTQKLFRYTGPSFSGSTRVQIGTNW
ncbi:FG-GAP repeat domain-containing protein [Streptomyces sp. NBC_01643]|uniref:FG-GAP repeat domain-containing protein n=1 Tax=Streptomyces sp. NBC_01643 TaxID=2975906 RepID=UPI003869DB97|nr:VCBS repeat-containing protein [Streptomyces sp. NBC_01643]